MIPTPELFGAALCLSSSTIGVSTEGREPFFILRCQIKQEIMKKTPACGVIWRISSCVGLLTTNGCYLKFHPWVGACSPEGSLRRAKENVRPKPASKNSTTDSCPMGYTPLHRGVSGMPFVASKAANQGFASGTSP